VTCCAATLRCSRVLRAGAENSIGTSGDGGSPLQSGMDGQGSPAA